MSTKLKCLLLDDELAALSYTKMLCEQIAGVEVVKAFNDPLKLVKAIPDLDFNTCILDIHMQELNGLEVAGHLKNKLIIFTTAYKDFAAEAFDLNAVDYIRKPLQKDRFDAAIAKAFIALENKFETKRGQFLWNTSQGKTLIASDDILYIRSSDIDSRDKFLLLKDGRNLSLKNITFYQILSALPGTQFCRINKKEIIAINTVRHFTADQVTTSFENRPFFLGEIYRSEFMQKIRSVQKQSGI